VILVIHIACPRLEYTDRGKSAVVLSIMKSEALISVITGVTKKWTKQRKREEREHSAVTHSPARRANTRYSFSGAGALTGKAPSSVQSPECSATITTTPRR
jgi:hypothetical protein